MITVREFLELQTNCYARINGNDVSRDIHDYDDWTVDAVTIDAYFRGYIGSDENANLNYSEFYLYVSANEPEK